MPSSKEYNIEGSSSVSSSMEILGAEGMSTLNISSSRFIGDLFLLWLLFSGVDTVDVEDSGELFVLLVGASSSSLLLLQEKMKLKN